LISDAFSLVANVWAQNELQLLGEQSVVFGRSLLKWHPKETLPQHSNGMRFTALDPSGTPLLPPREFFSIGGGFFVDKDGMESGDATQLCDVEERQPTASAAPPYPFHSATEMFELCKTHNLSIAELCFANEVILNFCF
jgi:L-serine dehydratase